VLLKFGGLCRKSFYHWNEVHSWPACKSQYTLDIPLNRQNHWNSIVFMLVEGKYDKLDVTISKNRNVVLKIVKCLMPYLYYGENHAKLVGFKEHEINILHINPLCDRAFNLSALFRCSIHLVP
jgi:hypothetical protein